ncbi:MAG: DNA polymerase III subunit delta [Kiritimatiellia bacterium]
MTGHLYIILGDDDYLVNSESQECIKRHLAPTEHEFGLEMIYGSVTTGGAAKVCVDSAISSVQTPSFFGGAKVTWLRDALFLPGGGKVSEYQESKDAAEKLHQFLQRELAEGQILIITAPKIRKNSNLYKTCSALSNVVDFGSGMKGWELEKAAAPRLDQLIEKKDIRMEPDARKEFLLRVGFDTRTIVSELEKLSLYVGDQNQITVADVREIVSIGREAEAWDVLKAFGQRDCAALVRSLDPLSGQSGIGIMLCAMIDKNIRELLVLREAFDRKWISSSGNWHGHLPVEADMLLKSLPGNFRTMGTWQLKNSLASARNYTQQELRVARFRIIELREKLVSSSQPEMFLLEVTLLRVMAGAQKKSINNRQSS